MLKLLTILFETEDPYELSNKVRAHETSAIEDEIKQPGSYHHIKLGPSNSNSQSISDKYQAQSRFFLSAQSNDMVTLSFEPQ